MTVAIPGPQYVEVAWASRMPLVAAAQIGVVHMVDLWTPRNAARDRRGIASPRRGDETMCGRDVGRHYFTGLPAAEPRCQRCIALWADALLDAEEAS